MQAYVLGLDKFEKAESQILAISADNIPSLRKFAEETKATFPMLSDFKDRNVLKEYGVLAASGVANRATFIVGKDGKIASIIEGSAAIDVNNAATECDRLAHKSAG